MNMIVIYDSDCGICSKSVEFIRKNDKFSLFESIPYFMAKQLMETYYINSNNQSFTVTLIFNNNVFIKSKAVLIILEHLFPKFKYFYRFFHTKFLLKFSDFIYDLIAANRTKISRILGLNACKINL